MHTCIFRIYHSAQPAWAAYLSGAERHFLHMTTGTMRVTDPVGRAVELPEGLCLGGTADAQPPEIYNEYQKVVETPASIIERADGRLYYFRSLGWNFTVLIEVAWRGEGWYAVRCHKNPAPPDIAALLKDGTFVAGSSLEPPGS